MNEDGRRREQELTSTDHVWSWRFSWLQRWYLGHWQLGLVYSSQISNEADVQVSLFQQKCLLWIYQILIVIAFQRKALTLQKVEQSTCIRETYFGIPMFKTLQQEVNVCFSLGGGGLCPF